MRLKRGDVDMTESSAWRLLLKFAAPMAVGLLFQQLYNTVDAVVVGRFVGKAALAAVGSTSSIVNTMVGLCAGLSTGASVVIAQSYGSHDNKRLHDAVHTTILVTLILCVLATGMGLIIVDPMLRFMDTPADVLPEAREYLSIYFCGLSGLLLYNMGSAILRAVGDAQRPLYFLCISAVVNVVFDLLFVIKFNFGVAGVAYATILAQCLSALLALLSLTRGDVPYGIRWNKLAIKREVLSRILAIGLPSGVQQAVTSFSNVFVQSYINNFGSACMAGWSGYNKIDVFILIPVQSIALASTTFVGQNYGAGKLKRAREGVRTALIMSIAVTALISGLVILARRPLLALFSTDPEVIDFGARFIGMISPFYVLICFNQIYGGALRGIGQARTPMLIMLGSFVLFRQIYLFVTKLLGVGFIAVALAYPAGWVLCSTLLIVFFRRSALFRAGAVDFAGADAAADAAQDA